MLMIERDKGTAVEGYIVWEFNPNKNEWDFVKRFNSLNAAINAFPNAFYHETLN